MYICTYIYIYICICHIIIQNKRRGPPTGPPDRLLYTCICISCIYVLLCRVHIYIYIYIILSIYVEDRRRPYDTYRIILYYNVYIYIYIIYTILCVYIYIYMYIHTYHIINIRRGPPTPRPDRHSQICIIHTGL